jgi:acyl-CoA thioester hydrolase
MSTPSASVQIRVSFADVDSSQRIHFTAMFRYFEVAEHELMRRIGLPYATSLSEVAMPRVHLSCDFKGAVRYDDRLVVVAEVEKVGRSSWTDAFTAYRLTDEEGWHPASEAIVATGHMTIVTMDPATQRAISLPEELRRALSGTAQLS